MNVVNNIITNYTNIFYFATSKLVQSYYEDDNYKTKCSGNIKIESLVDMSPWLQEADNNRLFSDLI